MPPPSVVIIPKPHQNPYIDLVSQVLQRKRERVSERVSSGEVLIKKMGLEVKHVVILNESV